MTHYAVLVVGEDWVAALEQFGPDLERDDEALIENLVADRDIRYYDAWLSVRRTRWDSWRVLHRDEPVLPTREGFRGTRPDPWHYGGYSYEPPSEDFWGQGTVADMAPEIRLATAGPLQVIEAPEEWDAWKPKLLRDLPPETLLTMCDIHI